MVVCVRVRLLFLLCVMCCSFAVFVCFFAVRLLCVFVFVRVLVCALSVCCVWSFVLDVRSLFVVVIFVCLLCFAWYCCSFVRCCALCDLRVSRCVFVLSVCTFVRVFSVRVFVIDRYSALFVCVLAC